MSVRRRSPQEVNDEPAEGEEDDDAGPEDPLVLLGPALDHADGVAADAERVGGAVEAALGALEHLALVAQVAEHGPAAVEELVELVRRVLEEGLLAQHAALAVVLAALGTRRVGIGAVGRTGIGGLGGRKGRVCRCRRHVWLGVGVLGRGGVVWTAAEQLGAGLARLHLLVGALDPLEVGAVLLQLGAERLEALMGLFLLGLHRLLPGQLAVVVDAAREGGERRVELRLEVRRWCCRVCKLVQLLADRCRLPQGRVEQRVLRPCQLPRARRVASTSTNHDDDAACRSKLQALCLHLSL